MASLSAASLWSASSASVGERSVRSSARSTRSTRSARSSPGGGGNATNSAVKRTHRAKLRANSANGSGGGHSHHSGGAAGGASRSDAVRLRLESALRNAEGGGSDDDLVLDSDGTLGSAGGAGVGVGAAGSIHSDAGYYTYEDGDTTAPLKDSSAGYRQRRRARSHEDLERGTAASGFGLYSSSRAREENRRRSEAYHDDPKPPEGGFGRSSRYSTGDFSADDGDDDVGEANNNINKAADSARSFDSEGSRNSSVGLRQIAHSLDVEERYGLRGRSSARGMGVGIGMGGVHAPSARDILNGNTSSNGSGGGGSGGFGYDDDGDRWAAREQRWLHQQRDLREKEMMGVGVHRDHVVDLHHHHHHHHYERDNNHDGNGKGENKHGDDEDRRLDELRRRSIGSMASGRSGGSGGSSGRRIRRSSMGQTVSSDAVPRVFAGSLASMGISISRNIAEEIPEPAVKTPTAARTAASSSRVGLTQTHTSSAAAVTTSPGSSASAAAATTTTAGDNPASFLPTSAQFNEQTNQLFSRLGSLGRTVGDSVGDAVSTALKNRQEQIKAQNRRAAAAAAATSGGKKKSRSGPRGGGKANAGGRQRRKRRNSARNAKNSSRFFTPSVDGRGVLPQTITEGDEEEDDTLFSKLAIRGFNLARLVDETVPNAERLAAESSGDEFDDDDLDDEEMDGEEEEKQSQASGERDYSRDGSGFDHPEQPPIPPEELHSGPNYGNQSLAASMFPTDSYEDDNRSTHWEVDSQADATTSFASRRSSQPQPHRQSQLSDHLNANNPSSAGAHSDDEGAHDQNDDAKSVQSQASSVRSSSSALSSKVAEWKREHRASGTRSVDGGGAGASTRSYSRNRRPRSGSSASNPPGEVVAIPIMSQRQRGVTVGTAGASGGANALAIATKNLSRLAEAQQQKKRNAAYAGGGSMDSSASTGALDRMKKSTSGDSLGSRGSAARSLRSVGGGNSTWNFANK